MPFLVRGVSVQMEAAIFLSDDNAVEQKAVFFLGATADYWESQIDEFCSG